MILSSTIKINNKWKEIGEVVTVKSGYAKNYLVPKSLARYATQGNLLALQTDRNLLSAKHESNIAEATQAAQLLEGRSFVLVRAASDDGRLYGSVLPRDIANEVNKVIKENLEIMLRIDPVHAQLEEGIKKIGFYSIKIGLYGPVGANVNVRVCRSTAEAEKLLSAAS